ncbi:maleylpyruvate isomerase N-terminal domain-containing protein [Streptomyces sp. NBC_00996]|uniref:maleylpyruvate isomerase N-terminal domain-containing protein n=1 Tax=Streptomyces sp. NBC_00996 TaxID=2903710 RepID=UPI003863C080
MPEEAWGSPTPCSEWTVRQVLNHARLDQQAYGAAITGVGRPDSDPFQPADLLDAGARAALDKVLRDVEDTYAALPAGAEEVATPLGPLPPRPWRPPRRAPWTRPCTLGTSPSRRARTRPWTRSWPRASGQPPSGSSIICGTRTGCSPPRARCPRAAAGPSLRPARGLGPGAVGRDGASALRPEGMPSANGYHHAVAARVR